MDSRRRMILAASLGLLTEKALGVEDRLPRIGLGTWQTFDVGGDAAARTQLLEVVQLLSQKRGSVVDSSPMYGSSELVAGELIESVGARERLFIATKVWTSGRDDGIRQMET